MKMSAADILQWLNKLKYLKRSSIFWMSDNQVDMISCIYQVSFLRQREAEACELFTLDTDGKRIPLFVECGGLRRICEIVIYQKIREKGIFFFFAFFDPMKDTLSGIPFNVSKSFWCIIGTTNNLSPTGKMEPQKGISQLSAWTNAKGSWFGALFGGDRKNSLKFKRTGSMFRHLQTVWPRTRLIISKTQTVGRTISFSHWVPTL